MQGPLAKSAGDPERQLGRSIYGVFLLAIAAAIVGPVLSYESDLAELDAITQAHLEREARTHAAALAHHLEMQAIRPSGEIRRSRPRMPSSSRAPTGCLGSGPDLRPRPAPWHGGGEAIERGHEGVVVGELRAREAREIEHRGAHLPTSA